MASDDGVWVGHAIGSEPTTGVHTTYSRTGPILFVSLRLAKRLGAFSFVQEGTRERTTTKNMCPSTYSQRIFQCHNGLNVVRRNMPIPSSTDEEYSGVFGWKRGVIARRKKNRNPSIETGAGNRGIV